MCGIYGYVGKKDAFKQVKLGLELLQYRGYDSCGIAYLTEKGFDVVKAVGTLNNLPKIKTKTKIAFGHTRWATHGAVNETNAHPHYSIDKEFTIVHNGIIKNADKLKEELQRKGIKFYSQTDLTNYLQNINVAGLVDKFKNKDRMILIGKGFDYLILQEASLKIREIDYCFTIPMYAGELKHGTLSLIDENTTVLALNTNKDANYLSSAICEIKSRKGNVANMENYFPCNISTMDYKAVFAILPFQLFSYQLAVHHGYNPDMPKNLAKSVTVE